MIDDLLFTCRLITQHDVTLQFADSAHLHLDKSQVFNSALKWIKTGSFARKEMTEGTAEKHSHGWLKVCRFMAPL